MQRDLSDPELFGNEAGEDEEPAVLASYFVEKDSFTSFYNENRRVQFVRSRKGMGKSALLSNTLFRARADNPGGLFIYVKASDLVALQPAQKSSPPDLINAWQQRICTKVNLEIGTTLKAGFSDDSVVLIESAELAGFRKRNLVSALIDRLNMKVDGFEVGRTRIPAANAKALLQRLQAGQDVSVWILIDDIDATFINTEEERLRVSTFFSACRALASTVKGLTIRASVRTDVWSLLKQHDEALDKCEQYMIDLNWSHEETGKMLERKVLSYFERYYPEKGNTLSLDSKESRSKVRRLVFKEPFSWGKKKYEAFRPIHILSAGRPRWAAQLCKLAGGDAVAKQSNKIAIGHVRAVLKPYGQLRIDDLYKEHRHQSDKLEDIIESFAGQSCRYSTSELLKHIVDKVIRNRGLPTIDGRRAEKGGITIAQFLYRIGFIQARDEEQDTGLGFIRFEDRPNLLSSFSNLDDSLPWEIHPSYRKVLRIKSE